MNPDGTIAGAPGLNLTDGNGRIIPVNLSVSIPMSSLAQVERTPEDSPSEEQPQHGGEEEEEKCRRHPNINAMYQNTLTNASSSSSSPSSKVITIISDDTGELTEITPRQPNPSKFLRNLFYFFGYNNKKEILLGL